MHLVLRSMGGHRIFLRLTIFTIAIFVYDFEIMLPRILLELLRQGLYQLDRLVLVLDVFGFLFCEFEIAILALILILLPLVTLDQKLIRSLI